MFLQRSPPLNSSCFKTNASVGLILFSKVLYIKKYEHWFCVVLGLGYAQILGLKGFH